VTETATRSAEISQPRSRPPLPAALLSAVVPGTGQWYSRRWLRGWILLIPALLLLAVLLALIGGSRDRLLELLVQPRVLWAIMAVNVALLAWRLFATVDAYRIASGGSWPGWVAGMVLAVLLALLAAPHVVVANYTLNTIDLLESVFVADEAAPPPRIVTPLEEVSEDAVPDPVTVFFEGVEAPTASSQRNRVFVDGFGDPEAIAAWPEIMAERSDRLAPFVAFEERVDTDRITILVAGGDAGPGRGGLRTDTMMVVTLDTVTGKAAVFGFPRNLAQIPLPSSFSGAFVEMEKQLAPPPPEPPPAAGGGEGGGGGGGEGEETTTTTPPTTTTTPPPPPFVSCKCYPDQLNSLYPRTNGWTRSFPNEVDPGMKALELTLENLMGLKIDYYALVDMAGFVRVIEAIGGVTVNVEQPLQAEVSPPWDGAPWATVDVDVGVHHLDGFEALAYVRARKGSSDYVRMERQRCMLRAVAAEADGLTVLRNFNAIAEAVKTSTTTNIPLSFLPDLVQATANLDFGDIATVGFTPGYYAPERDHRFKPIPDMNRIRAKVSRVLSDGPEAQSTDGVSECGV